MKTVYLIRHGQASFGAEDYDKLSALGGEQSRTLGRSLMARAIKPDVAISGNMLRHRETASICLSEMHGGLELSADSAWNEYDHVAVLSAFRPAWRDRAVMTAELMQSADARREFQVAFAQAMTRWISGEHDSDYTETWQEFCLRSTEALSRTLDDLPDGESALIFTSGGPISAISGQLLGMSAKHSVELGWTLCNAGVTRVVGRNGSPRLLTLNECAHLDHDHKLITYR